MASSYISITQTVAFSKLSAGINSFSSYSYYTKNTRSLSTIHKGYINPSFHLDQTRSALKHCTRVRKLESDWEENKDEEKSEPVEKKDEEKLEPEEDKEGDFRAEETVLKLYTDIKDQNIDGISEVIGDECQCFCNFFSKYRILQGKKQVMAFFYWLITELGKDIKIIVKPTFKDGMTVGVQWQVECGKSNVELGKGFSFHSCHMYQGKLLIKNVEMFMEPVFHIEPLRLRTMAVVVSLAEKIVTFLRPAGNTRRQAMTLLLIALLFLAAAAFYFTRLRF